MDWDEFTDLLSGLNEQTPLVRVAQIRTEEDKEVLKEYTPAQRRMRSEWQRKQAGKKSEKELGDFLQLMQKTFAKLSESGIERDR